MAIEQGLTILNWYENLDKKEVPPEHLWEDGEGLEQWWKKVERDRSDGRPDLDHSRQADSSDEDGPDAHQPAGMAENDLARYLKQQ